MRFPAELMELTDLILSSGFPKSGSKSFPDFFVSEEPRLVIASRLSTSSFTRYCSNSCSIYFFSLLLFSMFFGVSRFSCCIAVFGWNLEPTRFLFLLEFPPLQLPKLSVSLSRAFSEDYFVCLAFPVRSDFSDFSESRCTNYAFCKLERPPLGYYGIENFFPRY